MRATAVDGPFVDTFPASTATAREATHSAKVERIASELRRCEVGRSVVFRRGGVSHRVPKRTEGQKATRDRPPTVIDVHDLRDILLIDAENRRCVAEPGATFEDVCRATLPLGLAPAVVPELRTITVGGAVSGCSLESMSWKLGGFHDTCRQYEILTTDGEVVTATPSNEHARVFEMTHGTFGTLGLLTGLTFDLVPAKRYVHLAYETHATLETFQASIRRHAEAQDLDFMDGIIHANDCFVLSVGRFVDAAPYTHRYDWTRVYYRSTRELREDYLETEQYFFRYDRGVTNVHPKSFVGRLLFGKLLTSERLLRIARAFPRVLPKTPEVTLDVFVPSGRVPDFMRWYTEAIGFFPIWCVPYRRVRDYAWLDPSFYEGVSDDLFYDLAIYGCKQPHGRNLYREIEEELVRVNGVKTLISHNFYARDEFWRIWNRAAWAEVKAVTDRKNLLGDLYDKMCGRERTV